MMEELRKAADHIHRIEQSRKAEAESVRLENAVPKEALEPRFAIPLNAAKIRGKVSAVDGGILSYEMHGAELVIARAVSSTFVYGEDSGKVEQYSYFPSAFPEPSYRVETGLDEREAFWHKSLVRLEFEIQNALDTAKKEMPDYLLLDGSLCPLMADRPAEDSCLFPAYLSLLGKYKELYELCIQNSISLAGVIKDSRSKRVVEMLGGRISPGVSDTVFLHHFLREGERTFAFRYSDSPHKHTVLRELGKWG
ncbi:MAG: DNA double-strand break repair nuclease NurA, partial [Candidatus Bilamarchaeaceae archaeon]